MIGRQAELASVADLIDKHWLVTIVGPGGVGKTTLAQAVADRSDRTVLIADVARLSGHDLSQELSGELGFQSWSDLLTDVAHRPTLLVLDDCEHFVPDLAELLTELNRRCESLAVLATSREPLELMDERVFILQPLSLDGRPSEAAQLFLELAAARGHAISDQLDDVERLCRSLDGLPLAVELAAGRASALTPAEIRRSVETRLDLLSRTRPRGPERKSSLDAAIAWSTDQLNDRARMALESVSVFDGPFTLELASHVAGFTATADAVHQLQALIDRSLLVHEAAGETSWYRMLNTIRTHCQDRLARRGELAQARERFVDTVVTVCERLADPAAHMEDPRTPDEVRRSYRNVAAAIEWCLEHDPDPGRITRMMMPLYWLEDVGFQAEAAELISRVTDRWPDVGSTTWGVLANLHREAMQHDQARAAARRALETGEGFGAMMGHRVLGLLDYQYGEPERAVDHFRAGVQAARAAGLEAHAIELEGHRALAMVTMDDVPAAVDLLSELEERSVPYPLCKRCIQLFASHALLSVDPARSAMKSAAMLADARRHGHTWAVATAAYQVGVAAMLAGDAAGAAEPVAEALEASDAAHALVELRQALLLASAVLDRQGLSDDAWQARAAAARLPAKQMDESDRTVLTRIGVDLATPPPLAGKYSVAQTCRALRGVAREDTPSTAPEPRCAFIHRGDIWEVGYAGKTVLVRDSKGMSDLAVLLSRPRQEVSALDLMGAAVVSGDTGPAIDDQARAVYQERARELQAEIDEAERTNDPYRSERATAELDALVEQLTAAYGLGGRPRGSGETAERARTAVTWRVRAAIDRIRADHPDLADHLDRSVRTGRFCSYDPGDLIDWQT